MPQITQLDNDPTPNNNDLLVTVDVGAGTTKNISREQFFTGAPLPANTVNGQAIANGAVTNSKLAVTSSTNSGWNVINLGSIAILTIKTASRSTSTAAASQSTNLPSGLLSSILSVNATPTDMTGEARVFVSVLSTTGTSKIDLNYSTSSGSGTSRAYITVIGVLA